MLIRPKQCLLVAIPSFFVFVLGNKLDSVRNFKYLGVVLSSNLTLDYE